MGRNSMFAFSTVLNKNGCLRTTFTLLVSNLLSTCANFESFVTFSMQYICECHLSPGTNRDRERESGPLASQYQQELYQKVSWHSNTAALEAVEVT